jgi:LCP family protein required for cell wall assembly
MADDRPPRLWWGMWKRFLIGGALIVLLSAATTATVGLETVRSVADNLAQGGSQIRSPSLTADQAGAAQTILVIGSDKRAGSSVSQDRNSPPHTDTLLLVRMDPQAGQTSIMSIPRDLLVNIDYSGTLHRNEKINAAYSFGGAQQALKQVKQTLGGIAINHVVDLNFQAFRSVVDAVGCVYVDVDHRYYHSNLGLPPSQQYSEINVQPGYRRLCGQTALDYVRYRHTDSDFVRVARQQDFIRQAKEQVGVQGLINNYGQITSAVGKAIQTDIRGTTDVLRLLKLAAFSLGRPVRQVPFQTANANANVHGGNFVVATPYDIRQTVHDFLYGRQRVRLPSAAPVRARGRRASATPSPASIGLFAIPPGQRDQAVNMAAGLPFPLYLPTVKTGPAVPADAHAYAVRDERGHLHRGYRIDWQQSGLGGYYGIEGTSWRGPPLFAHARSALIGGRHYLLVDDGSHIHDIGWRTPHALYWVSNTLLEDLSNAQMLALAHSAQPVH